MSFGRWCVELDLAHGAQVRSTLPWSGQQQARVLVRLHQEPVGYVVAPAVDGVVDTETVVALAADLLADRISDHLAAEGLTDLRAGPADACRNLRVVDRTVTVAVATRDRPEITARCLSHLSALDYPGLEILVVDNAPRDARTQNTVLALAEADPRIRYLREDRPGVSYARNKALTEARGEVICYTDDDVAVDEGWVDGLLRGFRLAPAVGCVTGLVCTADIATDIEAYCDARLPLWSSRCEPEVFELDKPGDDPLFPFSVGVFGTGANFAFDVALLRQLGGFDPVLGAGTLTHGGEDLDLFLRVLYAGRPLVYSPAAVVWHSHRATHDGLMKQMFGYGSGLTALMTKVFLDKRTRGDLLRRVPRGVRRAASNNKGTAQRYDGPATPKGAVRRELTGLALGPLLYARSRRQHR